MCVRAVLWRAAPAVWTVENKRLCPVCVWQAVPWSSVCPELWEAGCAPAPGDVGSPRILTDLNLLLLFMALCCFSVPQLLSVIFQPQATSAAQPAVHSA